MWPFKKKKEVQPSDSTVRAKSDGVVAEIRYQVVVIGKKVYKVKAPLVYLGQEVKAGDPVGKKL